MENSLLIQILSFLELDVLAVIKDGRNLIHSIQYDDRESFYKLGISYKLDNGDIRRFREYRALNYNIEVIYTHTFSDAIECKEFELKLKQLIKPSLYIPSRWEYNTSTETFTDELLPTIKENLIYDIVSTSSESQSSEESKDSNTDVN